MIPYRCITALTQVDRMVDIAGLALDDVSDEEKIRYKARIKETGEYLGYKLPQYWVCDEIVCVIRR
jgi:hypothetical protein